MNISAGWTTYPTWISGVTFVSFPYTISCAGTYNLATKNESVPFFETTIRYLGGLLSAYGLTHDPILLARADDLGSVMLPVFNTSSGLPVYSVNPSKYVPPTPLLR